MMPSIIAHLERHLGQLHRGWAPAAEPCGVQVCLFQNQPILNVSTFSTAGMSEHILAMPRDREVRQELLMAVRSELEAPDISQLLFHVAQPIVDQHRAALRGEVIALGYPIRPQSALTNLYVSIPVVFPDSLSTYSDTTPETVFAWLIPISESEAVFIRMHGWSRFEDALEQADPDLFDLHRKPIL